MPLLGRCRRLPHYNLTMTIKAVGYIRQSRRKDSEASPESQRESIEAHCKANGWELVGFHEDIGVSGWEDHSKVLMTYHAPDGDSSSRYFHNEPWLDFNMLQSGHDYNRENYKKIAADHARRPAKPCMDAEPGYEDHPAGFDRKNGYLDDHDVRKFAYWALFAGARHIDR